MAAFGSRAMSMSWEGGEVAALGASAGIGVNNAARTADEKPLGLGNADVVFGWCGTKNRPE
jgi:hypothetical protein